MTPAQAKCIEYHLWKTTDKVSFQEWLSIRDQIDKSTASNIIKAFKEDNIDMAVNQIKHLCQN